MIAGQQPSAHQGPAPRDPDLPEVTRSGDGIASGAYRTWILGVAAIVVVIAAVVWWRTATNNDDSAAREAMAAQGIAISEDYSDRVTVREIDGGFTVFVEGDSASGLSGYNFALTPTTADTATGWEEYSWSDATAYVSWDPRPTLVLDADGDVWQANISSITGNSDEESARSAFGQLDAATEFVTAP